MTSVEGNGKAALQGRVHKGVAKKPGGLLIQAVAGHEVALHETGKVPRNEKVWPYLAPNVIHAGNPHESTTHNYDEGL